MVYFFSGRSSVQHRGCKILANFGKFVLSGANFSVYFLHGFTYFGNTKNDNYEVCTWPELLARCRSWPSVRYDTRTHIEADLASILRIRNMFLKSALKNWRSMNDSNEDLLSSWTQDRYSSRLWMMMSSRPIIQVSAMGEPASTWYSSPPWTYLQIKYLAFHNTWNFYWGFGDSSPFSPSRSSMIRQICKHKYD